MEGGIGCWRRNFRPSSCPPRKCCQSFCSASVMSLRKRRAFRSVVVGSGGLTVVISPYPPPSPLPTGAGANSEGSRASLSAAVVCLSLFHHTLTPPHPSQQRHSIGKTSTC